MIKWRITKEKKNQKEIVLVYKHSLVGKKKGLLDTKPKKLMGKRLLILFGIKFVRVYKEEWGKK